MTRPGECESVSDSQQAADQPIDEADAPAVEEVDTGRMSDGEYESFSRRLAEAIDESLQYSDGVQTCSVLGVNLELAAYIACMDDSYSGFEEDAQTAYAVGDSLRSDVAKKCEKALNSYLKVLDRYATTVEAGYEAATALQFDRIETEFKKPPKAAKRYTKFHLNALGACAPR